MRCLSVNLIHTWTHVLKIYTPHVSLIVTANVQLLLCLLLLVFS